MRHQTVPALLARTARTHPERLAVVDGEHRLTWAQLAEETQQVARALLALQVEPGEKVVILGPNDHYWIRASLAVLSIGAVLVPANTRYSGHELHDLLARTDATVLLTADGFLGRNYVADIREAAAELANDNAGDATLSDALIDGLPHLRNIIVWPQPTDTGIPTAGVHPWGRFLSTADTVPVSAATWRAAAVSPEDHADIVFTSGTTGRSKGAVSAQRHTVSCAVAWAHNVQLTPEDNYLIVSPFAHTFGYKAGMLACVASGATMYPMGTFDTEAAIDALEREQITVFPGTPTIFQMILDHPRRPDAAHLNWRISVTGAATVPVRMIERMYEELGLATVMTGYGLSEAVTVAMTAIGDPPELVSTSTGKPIADFEIRIRDADGNILGPEETGEIEVRGPNVMAGYLNDPEATAEVIDADGWLRTGDVGKLSADGYLTITDRLKDMFTVGGFNVYPAEIEHQLSRIPGVLESAVVGVPHTRLGSVGKAFVQRARGSAVTEEQILDHLTRRVAKFKVPRSVEFVEEFPRNEAGKILKRVLLDNETGMNRTGNGAASRNEGNSGTKRQA